MVLVQPLRLNFVPFDHIVYERVTPRCGKFQRNFRHHIVVEEILFGGEHQGGGDDRVAQSGVVLLHERCAGGFLERRKGGHAQ